MALVAGSCTIATTGVVSGTRLAKGIADAHTTAFAAVSIPADILAKLMSSGYIAAFSNALAAAIVAEVANGTITVIVHTTDVGLQTSAAAGVATTGPASNKTLTGTIA